MTADRADNERHLDKWLRFSPPSFALFRAERRRLCHCCAGSWCLVVVAGATLIAGDGSSTDNEKSARRSVGASCVEYAVYCREKVALAMCGFVVLLFGSARCVEKEREQVWVTTLKIHFPIFRRTKPRCQVNAVARRHSYELIPMPLYRRVPIQTGSHAIMRHSWPPRHICGPQRHLAINSTCPLLPVIA